MEKLINQPIGLTFAQYESSLVAERVITGIIKALQPNMRYKGDVSQFPTIFDTRVVTLKTKSLLPPGSQNHSQVKKCLKFLRSKDFQIIGEDKDGKYVLFTSLILQFKYHQNNQIVKIEFSNDVLAYLLNNTLGYTRFSQETLFSLSSPYTARTYKVISHWRDKKMALKDALL